MKKILIFCFISCVINTLSAWTCPECQQENDAFRVICEHCNTQKTSGLYKEDEIKKKAFQVYCTKKTIDNLAKESRMNKVIPPQFPHPGIKAVPPPKVNKGWFKKGFFASIIAAIGSFFAWLFGKKTNKQNNIDNTNYDHIQKIVIACPNCGQKLSVIRSTNKKLRCPACHHIFRNNT